MATMTDPSLPTSLNFLTDAAHLLASTSPQISAHLMFQRNSLVHAHELELPDVQRQHVCSACGHIMVPGQGDSLKIDTVRMARQKRPKREQGQKLKPTTTPKPKILVKRVKCASCERQTNIAIQSTPTPITRRKRSTINPSFSSSSEKGSKTASNEAKPTTATIPTRIPGQMTTPAFGHSTLPSARAAPEAPGDEPAKASANASSKKRAKNRKQGLQALLQQSNASKPQTGLGLSLSDFMKK